MDLTSSDFLSLLLTKRDFFPTAGIVWGWESESDIAPSFYGISPHEAALNVHQNIKI